jgi:hypothetical protein
MTRHLEFQYVLAEEAQILFSSDEFWQGKPGLIIDSLLGMYFCSNLTKDVNLNEPSNCMKGEQTISCEYFIRLML